MPFWNPHQHKMGGVKDFAWLLEQLKKAFWKVSTKRTGNTLEIRFTPQSPWMGQEVVETLSIEAGAKGDKGDTGPRGLKGDKGDTGVQGERGLPGDAVYSCDSKTLNKVVADRALCIGKVDQVAGSGCNAFMLSVYTEVKQMGALANYQAFNAIIVTDRTGANFVPVSYNAHKYSTSGGAVMPTATDSNEYWLRGVAVTYSSTDATPNSIYLLGASESFAKAVNISWSIMPFMGVAESVQSDTISINEIVGLNEKYYL